MTDLEGRYPAVAGSYAVGLVPAKLVIIRHRRFASNVTSEVTRA